MKAGAEPVHEDLSLKCESACPKPRFLFNERVSHQGRKSLFSNHLTPPLLLLPNIPSSNISYQHLPDASSVQCAHPASKPLPSRPHSSCCWSLNKPDQKGWGLRNEHQQQHNCGKLLTKQWSESRGESHTRRSRCMNERWGREEELKSHTRREGTSMRVAYYDS